MFLKGLREGGVPIKCSSWHTYQFSLTGANVNLLIQERSRSVKSIFAVQKYPTKDFARDNGATFYDTTTNGAGTLQNYQYRIGGRYFPASPVQTSNVGGSWSNGAAEAKLELDKALNVIGDYRLSSNVNQNTWGLQGPYSGALNDQDYRACVEYIDGNTGAPVIFNDTSFEDLVNPGFCGGLPSANFAMAINLETSNGLEVAGLNAEEQSDIALLARWSGNQGGGTGAFNMNMFVFVYFDLMIILRENNVLELVQ